MEELLVVSGGAVKATSDGRVEGILIPFGDPARLDLDGEFFDASTDYDRDFPGKVSTRWEHGFDPALGKKRLTRAEVGVDELGVWFKDQLDLSDQYQAKIHALAQAGRLYLSSGSAPHLVEKEQVGKAVRITSWPLVEASYTVKPANPNAPVRAVKAADVMTLEDAVKSLASLSLSDHAAQVETTLRELNTLVARFEARAEFRANDPVKAGRVLSAANMESLSSMRAEIQALLRRLEGLLERGRPKENEENNPEQTAAPSADAARMETARLRTETLRLQSRIGVLNR